MNIEMVPVDRLLASATNPRQDMDDAQLAALVASIEQDGVLEPIRATREGHYLRIESGHRRFAAASAAGLTQVPVVVVEQDASSEQVRALVTNVQRENLNVIDEARAYQHLIAVHGLTALGAAQRVGVSPTRVTQRLELLEFDEQIIGLFQSGKLSPNTRTSLKAIARVSTSLASSVAKLTVRNAWDGALAKQPGLVALQVSKDKKGVYALPGRYLLGEDFKLTAESQPELALLYPSGHEPTEAVTFTSADLDAARAAGVAYQGKGSEYGIVDDQAWIESQLIVALRRRQADRDAQKVDQAKHMIAEGKVRPETTVSEAQEIKEANAAERQAHLNAREVAHAANLELGRVILTELAKIEVGSMPMPVAQLISRGLLGDRRSGVFLAGLRYCLPQYIKEVDASTKTKKITKRVYVDLHKEAAEKLQEWLDGATTPAELIGRTVAAMVAAQYADQGVVPQSQRKSTDLPRGAEDHEFVTALHAYAKLLVPKELRLVEKPSAKHVREALAG